MRKVDAFVNAQSVFSWAVLFGHGTLHQLTNWSTEFELTVHFPNDQFVLDREDEEFGSVVMADAKIEWTDRTDIGIWVLSISWRYSK